MKAAEMILSFGKALVQLPGFWQFPRFCQFQSPFRALFFSEIQLGTRLHCS